MLNELQHRPNGLDAVDGLLARLDQAFALGFAGGLQHEALAGVERVFRGTPLEARLLESAHAIRAGAFDERHFVALAAARSALLGAQHDALVEQARRALGRPRTPEPALAPPVAPEPILAGARHWLMELAISGFARLDVPAVLPFMATLAQLRQNPNLGRLSFLLTGFVDELLDAAPVARPEDIPLTRWADLWSAAMLGAAGRATPDAACAVSGTLYPIGVDIRQAAHAVSVVVLGVLTRGGAAEVVRLTCSRFKVATVCGDELWLLLPEVAPLLDALAQGQALVLRDMPMLPNGELLWNQELARPGEKYRPLELAARFLAPQAAEQAIIPPLAPLDRHPVQIAEPLALREFALQGDGLLLGDGFALPLDRRWRAVGEPGAEALGEAAALFGLLRHDEGRWSFQPLAAASRAGKLAFAGQSGAKLLKKPPKTSTVATLEERASRLLRK